MKIADEKKLEPCDDSYELTFPLAINSNYHLPNQLFIHTNGLLTFESAISFSGDIASKLYRNTIYIAPLWSDIDTNLRGQIVHGELENLNGLKHLINEIKHATDLDKSKI